MSKPSLLVIINPISGRGKALNNFNKIKHKLASIFDLDIFISEYSGHVNDYFSTEVILHDKIISVGGDGLLFEIINNIINHDARKDIPIGVIPSGSGNGFFQSIVHENDEKFNLDNSISIIKKNNTSKCDVMKVDFNNTTKYGCLAISWGIISELDIKTEWLRCLGSLRFDLGGVWNIIKKPQFTGTLKYLDEKTNEEIIETGKFAYLWACNTSHSSYNILSSPYSNMNDGYMYISYVKYPISRFQLVRILLGFASGKFIRNRFVKYIKTKQFSLNIKNGLLTLDGELLKTEAISVNIMEEKLNVIS